MFKNRTIKLLENNLTRLYSSNLSTFSLEIDKRFLAKPTKLQTLRKSTKLLKPDNYKLCDRMDKNLIRKFSVNSDKEKVTPFIDKLTSDEYQSLSSILSEDQKKIVSKFDSDEQLDPESYEQLILAVKKLCDNRLEFLECRFSPLFVDKTLLIKKILDLKTTSCHIICGPRRWGKTTNLMMLSDFFSINEFKKNNRNPQIEIGRRILFKGTKIDNSENRSLFENHFGQYPVIYLDFKSIEGTNLEEIKEKMGIVCNTMKKDYRYLLKEPSIDNDLKDILNCKDDYFYEDAALKLVDFCQSLSLHFKKKVYHFD